MIMKMSTKENLKKIFGEHVCLVEPVIEELLLDSVDPRHKEAVLYQMAGGKRLRPVLTMIVCQMMGGEVEDVLYPAAGLEIMHNYTLIVDDRMDHSELRHNQPTVWKKFGPAISECIAVYYACAIFQGANRGKFGRELTDLFARVLKKIDDGQVLDVLFERSGRQDEPYVLEKRFKEVRKDNYFEMIGGKTASLYSGCCGVGGVCAEATDSDIKNLKNFGLNLGLAFQIKDDLLDVFGDEKKFGKEVGKDIKEKKVSNIVILLSLEKLKGTDKKEIEDILNRDVIGKQEVGRATELIRKTDAREEAENMGLEFIKKAKESLKNLPQNRWNSVLSDLVDYIVARDK